MKNKDIIFSILLCILLSATFISVDAPYMNVYAATESQKQAIDFAKGYLKEHPRCCKQELMDVLNQKYALSSTSEYAADYCGANWNKRAVKAAKSYLKMSPFSKKFLIELLEFQGFTEKEAKYGVKKCGASWNEQAVRAAEGLCDRCSKQCNFSKQFVIEELSNKGFTDAQIEYAMSKVNIVDNNKNNEVYDYTSISYGDFFE